MSAPLIPTQLTLAQQFGLGLLELHAELDTNLVLLRKVTDSRVQTYLQFMDRLDPNSRCDFGTAIAARFWRSELPEMIGLVRRYETMLCEFDDADRVSRLHGPSGNPNVSVRRHLPESVRSALETVRSGIWHEDQSLGMWHIATQSKTLEISIDTGGGYIKYLCFVCNRERQRISFSLTPVSLLGIGSETCWPDDTAIDVALVTTLIQQSVARLAQRVDDVLG